MISYDEIGLQEKLFSQVVAALMERGLILKKGTIVGKGIINNSKTKILLNLEEEEAQRVQGVLHLSEAELMEITHFERGSALISTNNNNIAVEIKCSQMEKELITTDRRELAELAQRAAPKQHPC